MESEEAPAFDSALLALGDCEGCVHIWRAVSGAPLAYICVLTPLGSGPSDKGLRPAGVDSNPPGCCVDEWVETLAFSADGKSHGVADGHQVGSPYPHSHHTPNANPGKSLGVAAGRRVACIDIAAMYDTSAQRSSHHKPHSLPISSRSLQQPAAHLLPLLCVTDACRTVYSLCVSTERTSAATCVAYAGYGGVGLVTARHRTSTSPDSLHCAAPSEDISEGVSAGTSEGTSEVELEIGAAAVLSVSLCVCV